MDINYEVRGEGFWDVLDGLSVVAFERCSGESLTGGCVGVAGDEVLRARCESSGALEGQRQGYLKAH
jgi:hypothetical protein